MPRHVRIVVSGFPMHAILRGIDRAAIFFSDAPAGGTGLAVGTVIAGLLYARYTKLQGVAVSARLAQRAHAFATIRSYLSTLHKQSIDAYQALVMTFQGNPPMPRLA